VRGIDIGEKLLAETEAAGVEVWLDTVVWSLFEACPERSRRDNVVAYHHGGRAGSLQAQRLIIATGAMEKAVAFPGWTLPGVMGAGAAQTMINLHRVRPGRRAVMIGSGNVGLIVAYQLLQAGTEVALVVEALPRIGGYGVHAAKLVRAGVPICTSCTVREARGDGRVEEVVVADLDEDWQSVPGSEKVIAADTVCLAVGLSPLAELAWLMGCRFKYVAELGGHVPIHDRNMETTVPGVYIAGDVSGIEEASTAMEEGRLAGLSAAASLGYLPPDEAESRKARIWQQFESLRQGSFGQAMMQGKAALMAEERGKQ
jgi:thioredoxin reductase